VAYDSSSGTYSLEFAHTASGVAAQCWLPNVSSHLITTTATDGPTLAERAGTLPRGTDVECDRHGSGRYHCAIITAVKGGPTTTEVTYDIALRSGSTLFAVGPKSLRLPLRKGRNVTMACVPPLRINNRMSDIVFKQHASTPEAPGSTTRSGLEATIVSMVRDIHRVAMSS